MAIEITSRIFESLKLNDWMDADEMGFRALAFTETLRLINLDQKLVQTIERYQFDIDNKRAKAAELVENSEEGSYNFRINWTRDANGAIQTVTAGDQVLKIGSKRLPSAPTPESTGDLVRLLAHELNGHFDDFDRLAREVLRADQNRSVEQFTAAYHLSEGFALLAEIESVRRIAAAGGPTIPVPGRPGYDLIGMVSKLEHQAQGLYNGSMSPEQANYLTRFAAAQMLADYNRGNLVSIDTGLNLNYTEYYLLGAKTRYFGVFDGGGGEGPVYGPGAVIPTDIRGGFSGVTQPDGKLSSEGYIRVGDTEVNISSTIDAAGNGSLTSTVTGDVVSATQSWTIGGGTASDTPNLSLGGAGEVFARTNTELEQAAAALTLRGIAVADGDLIRYIDANSNGALDDGETARVVHGGADGQGYAIDLTANGVNQWDVDNIDLMRLQGGSPTNSTVGLSGLNDALGQSDTASPFTVPSVGAVMGELENLALTLGGVDPTVAKALGILRNAGVSAVQAGTGGGVDAFVGSLAVAGVTTTGALVGQWFGGELADALGIDRRLVAPVAGTAGSILAVELASQAPAELLSTMGLNSSSFYSGSGLYTSAGINPDTGYEVFSLNPAALIAIPIMGQIHAGAAANDDSAADAARVDGQCWDGRAAA